MESVSAAHFVVARNPKSFGISLAGMKVVWFLELVFSPVYMGCVKLDLLILGKSVAKRCGRSCGRMRIEISIFTIGSEFNLKRILNEKRAGPAAGRPRTLHKAYEKTHEPHRQAPRVAEDLRVIAGQPADAAGPRAPPPRAATGVAGILV